MFCIFYQRVGKCEAKAYETIHGHIADTASQCKLPGMSQALSILKGLQFTVWWFVFFTIVKKDKIKMQEIKTDNNKRK